MKKVFLCLLVLSAAMAQAQVTYESVPEGLKEAKAKCKADGNDTRALILMERMNEEVLEAGNPVLSEKTIALYKAFSEDPTLPNSHIFYLFNLYQNEITKADVTNDFQIGCMKLLSGECIATYKKIPAIVLIYMGEALMRAGMEDKAREHFSTAASYYPKSLPIKVYNFLLMAHGDEKEKIKKELLKKHASHWMVKDMVK